MPLPPDAGYHAPWWLPGGHLQTLYPALLARLRHVPLRYRRERWDTPDGDFIDVDFVDAPQGAPTLVLFHGLEGSSRSHYAVSLMQAAARAGWRGVLPHFRGCGGEPNRLPRAYHSGDSAEIDWILRRLRAGATQLHAAGVSLGGNALLRWLGEQGEAAAEVVARAAAVSAPLDLVAAGTALERGLSRVYAAHFLQSLRPKAIGKLARFPGLYDAERVAASRTLREFDDLVTAPLHGYRGVMDYWTRASCKPLLGEIRVPCLVINARNDPFLPEAALPGAPARNDHLVFEFPLQGGHVGFCAGSFPGSLQWLPQRLLRFFGAREQSPARGMEATPPVMG